MNTWVPEIQGLCARSFGGAVREASQRRSSTGLWKQLKNLKCWGVLPWAVGKAYSSKVLSMIMPNICSFCLQSFPLTSDLNYHSMWIWYQLSHDAQLDCASSCLHAELAAQGQGLPCSLYPSAQEEQDQKIWVNIGSHYFFPGSCRTSSFSFLIIYSVLPVLHHILIFQSYFPY